MRLESWTSQAVFLHTHTRLHARTKPQGNWIAHTVCVQIVLQCLALETGVQYGLPIINYRQLPTLCLCCRQWLTVAFSLVYIALCRCTRIVFRSVYSLTHLVSWPARSLDASIAYHTDSKCGPDQKFPLAQLGALNDGSGQEDVDEKPVLPFSLLVVTCHGDFFPLYV